MTMMKRFLTVLYLLHPPQNEYDVEDTRDNLASTSRSFFSSLPLHYSCAKSPLNFVDIIGRALDEKNTPCELEYISDFIVKVQLSLLFSFIVLSSSELDYQTFEI